MLSLPWPEVHIVHGNGFCISWRHPRFEVGNVKEKKTFATEALPGVIQKVIIVFRPVPWGGSMSTTFRMFGDTKVVGCVDIAVSWYQNQNQRSLSSSDDFKGWCYVSTFYTAHMWYFQSVLHLSAFWRKVTTYMAYTGYVCVSNRRSQISMWTFHVYFWWNEDYTVHAGYVVCRRLRRP